MCDAPDMDFLLGVVIAAMTLAIALIGVAIATNAALFTAGGSVALMTAAALAAGVATAGLDTLLNSVNNFNACMSSPDACIGHFSDLSQMINGLRITMAILTGSCVAVALVAWIPWGAIAPMTVVLAAIVIELALFPLLVHYYSVYKSCLDQASIAVAMGPLVIGASLFELVVVAWFFSCFKKRQKLLKALKAS